MASTDFNRAVVAHMLREMADRVESDEEIEDVRLTFDREIEDDTMPGDTARRVRPRRGIMGDETMGLEIRLKVPCEADHE